MGKMKEYYHDKIEASLRPIFVLKLDVKQRLDKNTYLKSMLAIKNGKSIYTIQKWINENNPILTTADNQFWIKKGLGLHDGFDIITRQNPFTETAMADNSQAETR